MPTLTAKNTLLMLWPLIFKGRDRSLTPQETEELDRLCTVLKSSVPALPGYPEEAKNFCVSLHDSGVFETGRIKDADTLLEKVDHLRHLLN